MASTTRVSDCNGDGIIDGDGDGQPDDQERCLPISERFFSGGATNLRGFKFETAGPQIVVEPPLKSNDRCDTPGRPEDLPCILPTLVPSGGDALAVFNFEMRSPLTDRLRLVPFYDLGNVFRRARELNFGAMTNTLGLGLRVNTPLGPVGVDYGYLIDPPAFKTAVRRRLASTTWRDSY